jgi:ketosteroid isomerase-like protein
MSTLALISAYYDACSTGDADGVTATVTDDVVHYFLAPNLATTPVAGGEHLGGYWRKVHGRFAPRWVVDRIISEADEAAIEWTMFWRARTGGERVATRGAEWFVLRSGRIAEIRSYYRQEHETSELDGFPYAERGYSVAGAERNAIHVARVGRSRAFELAASGRRIDAHEAVALGLATQKRAPNYAERVPPTGATT